MGGPGGPESELPSQIRNSIEVPRPCTVWNLPFAASVAPRASASPRLADRKQAITATRSSSDYQSTSSPGNVPGSFDRPAAWQPRRPREGQDRGGGVPRGDPLRALTVQPNPLTLTINLTLTVQHNPLTLTLTLTPTVQPNPLTLTLTRTVQTNPLTLTLTRTVQTNPLTPRP